MRLHPGSEERGNVSQREGDVRAEMGLLIKRYRIAHQHHMLTLCVMYVCFLAVFVEFRSEGYPQNNVRTSNISAGAGFTSTQQRKYLEQTLCCCCGSHLPCVQLSTLYTRRERRKKQLFSSLLAWLIRRSFIGQGLRPRNRRPYLGSSTRNNLEMIIIAAALTNWNRLRIIATTVAIWNL